MEADLEFLMRVALKIETIREDLGKVGTVIAEQVEEAMLGRRTTLEHREGREGSRADSQDAQVRAGFAEASSGVDGAVPGNTERTSPLAGQHLPSGNGRFIAGGSTGTHTHQDRRRQAVFPIAASQGKLGGMCGRTR